MSEQLDFPMQKVKKKLKKLKSPLFLPHTTQQTLTHSGSCILLNVKGKIIKFLTEDIGRNLCDFELRGDFIFRTQKWKPLKKVINGISLELKTYILWKTVEKVSHDWG